MKRTSLVPIVINIVAHLLDQSLHQMWVWRLMRAFMDPNGYGTPFPGVGFKARHRGFLQLPNVRGLEGEWPIRIQKILDHFETEVVLA